MEEFKYLLNKIMIYTIISFELKFQDSREEKGIEFGISAKLQISRLLQWHPLQWFYSIQSIRTS